MKERPFKVLFGWVLAGALSSMTLLSALLARWTGEPRLLLGGLILSACAGLWLWVLTAVFNARLKDFAQALCQTLDRLLAGEAAFPAEDRDTLLSRVQHRLVRLCTVLTESRRKGERERRELQELVSDISHQVKTPLSNLRMLSDTLLARPVTEAERRDFLRGIWEQTDKLGFLLDALVKTSRLETGLIAPEKRDAPLYETLAQAMSGIVYAAEEKRLTVSVDCPEDLRLPHDSKWTAEALFNLLDNAVKYSPEGGAVRVTVERWEMSVHIRIADRGIGIPPEHRAAVFRRFYREETVRELPGVGIGLYLAREIIARQGGTVTVASELGKGSTFTVSLPLA